MIDENQPSVEGAEVSEVETEAKATVAAEQNVEQEESQESTPGKAEDKEAKRQAKLERRFARLTQEKYAEKARADALEKMLNQRDSQNQPQADDDDIESVIERKVAEREQKKAAETFYKKSEEILIKAAELGDFDLDDFIQLPKGAADAIVELEKPEILAYLQDNPEEIERLESMSPYRQAVEIGKLDAKLSAPKPIKKSAAPSPITPVGGKKPSQEADLYTIQNADDWIKERNKQAQR